MGKSWVFATVLTLVSSLAHAQGIEPPAGGGGGYAAPTIGSTVINSGATVTSITGMASFGITAPAVNTTAETISGYSLTGSDTHSMVSWAGTLNTSGTLDVLKLSVTDTSNTQGTNYFAVYGGAAGNSPVFRVNNHPGVAVGDIGTLGTFELGGSADMNTAQAVFSGQSGYALMKAENNSNSAMWPGVQFLSGTASYQGAIYMQYGAGFNGGGSVAGSATTSAVYWVYRSLGVATDWLKMPSTGILELGSNTIELGATINEGSASTYNTNISRTGNAAVAIGNGTAGDNSGTLDTGAYKVSGTAGTSCTLTVVAHLTVVNGIVTLCN